MTLSPWEKRILRMVMTQTRAEEQGPWHRVVERWGATWRPFGRYGSGWATRSASAAVSRALRRLERKGLVVRTNDISGSSRRTTRVKLTPLGRQVAEELDAAG